MPKGPQGQRRPADTVSAAIMVARIATGEESDSPAAKTARIKSGLAGAKARSESLTPAQRAEIAKKAAKERWRK
jgi:hypothetical protein